MRVAGFTILICAGLVLGAVTGKTDRSHVYAQQPEQLIKSLGKQANDLIALSSDASESHQQVTLIDTKTHVMSVYHIDRRTGEIALKSVRNVQWDLRMEEFNGVSPSPREIRTLLQGR